MLTCNRLTYNQIKKRFEDAMSHHVVISPEFSANILLVQSGMKPMYYCMEHPTLTQAQAKTLASLFNDCGISGKIEPEIIRKTGGQEYHIAFFLTGSNIDTLFDTYLKDRNAKHKQELWGLMLGYSYPGYSGLSEGLKCVVTIKHSTYERVICLQTIPKERLTNFKFIVKQWRPLFPKSVKLVIHTTDHKQGPGGFREMYKKWWLTY